MKINLQTKTLLTYMFLKRIKILKVLANRPCMFSKNDCFFDKNSIKVRLKRGNDTKIGIDSEHF